MTEIRKILLFRFEGKPFLELDIVNLINRDLNIDLWVQNFTIASLHLSKSLFLKDTIYSY